MNRIIIDNQTKHDTGKVVERVARVILTEPMPLKGAIVFQDGIAITCDVNKRSWRFVVSFSAAHVVL